ncbi:MAG: DNA double-strand break repair ATPase Rad50 [Archaeoglobaceae archaeon]
MILKELVLRNFKSHSNTRIRFERGINLIAGRNGAGKSSILEAILVALYGVRPPLRKDDLTRVGATDYSIELQFELGNKSYKIIRNSAGNSELRGDFLLEGDKRINEWVEKNISPFHVFTGAVYVRQGEIETIISDEAGREKIIRKLTRIEDYENAWKNLGLVIRELEAEMKRYAEVLKQKEDCEKRLREKVSEIEKISKEIEETKGKVAELKNKLALIAKEREKFEAIREQLLKLREETLRVEAEIKELKSRVELLESQRKELEERKRLLRRKYERFLELQSPAKRYVELETLHKEITKAIQELEKSLKSYEIEKERLINEAKRCEEEKENLKKLEEEIERTKSKIELLRAEAEKWNSIKSKVDRKEQIEKIFAEKGYSAEKIEQMFSAIQKARERDKSLKDELGKVREEKGALVSEEKRLEEILEKLKTAEGSCPVCGRELTESHTKELLDKYSMELNRVKAKILKIEEIERKLGEERKKIENVLSKQDVVLRYKQLVDEFRKITESLKDLDVEKLRIASQEMEKCVARIEMLKESQDRLAEVIKREEEVKRALETIKLEIERIEDSKKKLRSKLREAGFSDLLELEKELGNLRSSYEEWVSLKNSEIELKDVEAKIEIVSSEIDKAKLFLEQKIRDFEIEKTLLNKVATQYDEKKHKEVESEEKKISNEVSGFEERLTVLERTLESLAKDRDYLTKQLQVILESEKKAKAIEKALPELEKIREKFASYKNIVAEIALKEVEKYASEIFEEFTSGKYSGIRLKRVTEYGKERLKIFVLHQGEERETGFLSGGELVALGIAFRLALSMFEAKGKIPILILDEPTPFLDEERRRKLVDITTDYLRRIPQVIVVSHDEELKDAADKVITVDYRGGVSFVEAQ